MKTSTKVLSAILAMITLTSVGNSQNRGIVSIPLAEYRLNQEMYGPLDRLCVRDGNVFFLIDQSIGNETILPGFRYHTHDGTASTGANGEFHDCRETEEELKTLTALYPGIASFFTIGRSAEGRSINGIRISTRPESDQIPRIYILGCHHAREWISVEIPLDFARHLLESSISNPEIRNCVQQAQIYIIPIVNPDGLEYSIYRYRYWRKNRRYNGDFAWGVDINRNYGYMWGFDDAGSSPDPRNSVFRGEKPFSEPETAAIRDFMLLHPPAGVISYHNYSQTIIYPWGYTRNPATDDEEMKKLASEMSTYMETVNGRKYSYGSSSEMLYLTNGDCTDWVYGEFGAIAFTIELPPPSEIGHFFNSEEDIVPICQENRLGLTTFIAHFTNR